MRKVIAVKHNYRDSKGRFAKEPVGKKEPVGNWDKDFGEDFGVDVSHCVKPKTYYQTHYVNRSMLTSQCPICELAKEPIKDYGMPLNVSFGKDPTDFFESAPHFGKPSFFNPKYDEKYCVRVLGDVISYKQHFTITNKIDKIADRFMVNVLDLDDETAKVMTCGKHLMREIYKAIQDALNPPKLTRREAIVRWFKRNILKQRIEKEPLELSIEKTKGNRPYDIHYRVKKLKHKGIQ